MTDFMQAALDALEFEHQRRRRALCARAGEIRAIQDTVERINSAGGGLHISDVDANGPFPDPVVLVTSEVSASNKTLAEALIGGAGLDVYVQAAGTTVWTHPAHWRLITHWTANQPAAQPAGCSIDPEQVAA